MEAYLLFQKLFTGLMQRSCLGGHKEVLFLEGLQVLEGTVDVVQYSITLLLKPRQVIPHLPGKKKRRKGENQQKTSTISLSIFTNSAAYRDAGGTFP